MSDEQQLTEEQLAQLLLGGDCPLHYHSSDKTPTSDTVRRLQQLERVVSVSVATNMATNASAKDADYVRVDSTAGSTTITLPFAKNNGRRATVSRVAGANNVIIAAQSGEAVSGTTTINTSFAPRTFKAISATSWEEV